MTTTSDYPDKENKTPDEKIYNLDKMKDTQGDKVRSMERTDEFEVTDNNHMTKASDKYTDSIDLSNACREFYQSRKRAAEVVKEKLATSGRQRTTKKKTSIDVAMETLRTEMTGLMDQDLSLMKQLLTLNEAIEDLKWQRKYYHSQSSMPESSCDLNESDWSVSETDMFGSENEVLKKYPTSSSLSTTSHVIRREVCNADDTEREYLFSASSEINGNKKDGDKTQKISTNNQTFVVPIETRNFLELPTELDLFLNGTTKFCHEEQNSFDSGIHEPVLRQQITV